tara:strand:+ start:65 stop:166 length:102 start_codon:yes stop_codon:yes gene_type:complete
MATTLALKGKQWAGGFGTGCRWHQLVLAREALF